MATSIPTGYLLWEKHRDSVLAHAVSRPCPVCGSPSTQDYHPTQDGYRTVICNDCEMVYIPEIVPLSVWNDFYFKLPDVAKFMEEYAKAASHNTTPKPENLKRFNDYFFRLEKIIHPFSLYGARHLDIGTFDGDALLVSEQQFHMQALGIEGRRELAVKVAAVKNLDIRPSSGESILNLHLGDFDVVTAFEVLEHATDPMEFVAQVMESMNPGGLFMITVPNIDNFEVQALREYSPHVSGGIVETGHVNWFSKNTLCNLLKNKGFIIKSAFTQYGSSLENVYLHRKRLSDNIPCYGSIATGAYEKPALPTEVRDTISTLAEIFNVWENSNDQGPILGIICQKPGEANWRAHNPANETTKKSSDSLFRINPGEIDWIASPSSVINGKFVYHGFPESAYCYLLISKKIKPSGALNISVKGKLKSGSITIGIQQNDKWYNQKTIDTVGDFDISLKTPAVGKFFVVVANNQSCENVFIRRRNKQECGFEITHLGRS